MKTVTDINHTISNTKHVGYNFVWNNLSFIYVKIFCILDTLKIKYYLWAPCPNVVSQGHLACLFCLYYYLGTILKTLPDFPRRLSCAHLHSLSAQLSGPTSLFESRFPSSPLLPELSGVSVSQLSLEKCRCCLRPNDP